MNDAANSLVLEAFFGGVEKLFEYPFSRLVMNDDLAYRVALGCGVLRVRSHIQVKARPVHEEDI